MTECVRPIVGVRIRPQNAREKRTDTVASISSGCGIVELEDLKKNVTNEYHFDAAFDSSNPSSPGFADQAKVYEVFGQPVLEHILAGFKTCVFAYGQTGSGKTHTMMGTEKPESDRGLVLRFLNDLFAEVEKQKEGGAQVQCKVKMLEIYNEKLRDLLVPPSKSTTQMDVHVHPKLGVYVPGLTSNVVSSFSEVAQMLQYGNTMKTVASTSMNSQSSRSHTLFAISYEKDKLEGEDSSMTELAEVYFVDLAGRENERTTLAKDQRLVELSFINRSLFHLTTCINSLARETGKKMNMSLFRNSKLTLLLSQALHGNSKTRMMGTLSPSALNFEDSKATLSFAASVKNIKIEAKAVTFDKKSMLADLQEEISRLKAELATAKAEAIDPKSSAEKSRVEKDQVEALEYLEEELGKTVQDLQTEAAEARKNRTASLLRLGVAKWKLREADSILEQPGPEDDSMYPYLENVEDDPHLCGTLVYHLPVDVYCSVGSDRGNQFVLEGLGIEPLMCKLLNISGRGVSLRVPGLHESTSYTNSTPRVEVDGKIVEPGGDGVLLKHGQVVLLGHAFKFRVHLYADASQKGSKIVDSESLNEMVISLIGDRDPEGQAVAHQYYNQLLRMHSTPESQTNLRAFLQSARRAVQLVDEANTISKRLRPGDHLMFELETHAPLLSYGSNFSKLPALCVRLLKTHSSAQRRWKLATETVMGRVGGLVGAVHDFMHIADESTHCAPGSEILCLWSFEKFISRLHFMRDLYDSWRQDPDNFYIDPNFDPWTECSFVQAQIDRHELSEANNTLKYLQQQVGNGVQVSQTVSYTYSQVTVDESEKLQQLEKKYDSVCAAKARLEEQLRLAKQRIEFLESRTLQSRTPAEVPIVSPGTRSREVLSERELEAVTHVRGPGQNALRISRNPNFPQRLISSTSERSFPTETVVHTPQRIASYTPKTIATQRMPVLCTGRPRIERELSPLQSPVGVWRTVERRYCRTPQRETSPPPPILRSPSPTTVYRLTTPPPTIGFSPPAYIQTMETPYIQTMETLQCPTVVGTPVESHMYLPIPGCASNFSVKSLPGQLRSPKG